MLGSEFRAALAQIDTARWRRSSLKLQVLLLAEVLSTDGGRSPEIDHEHGVQLGVRYVAASLGRSIRTVTVALDELIEERILRVGLEAAGSRGVTYVIESDLARWQVPWPAANPRELVQMRLDLLAGRLVQVVAPKPAFARATGRAQPWTARVTGRAQDSPSARPGARARSALVYAPSRAQTNPDLAPTPIPNNSASSSERDSNAQKVMQAITARTGAGVYGSLVGRISALVDNHNADELVRLVVAHPNANAGPPALVADLEASVATGAAGGPRRPAWVAEPDCGLCEGTGHVLAGRGAPPGPCPCRRSPETALVGESVA